MSLIEKFKERWSSKGGYREILMLAFPLILSSASWSVLHFVDRMFLTWFSNDAVAASMPAGILNFTIVSLFMGTANYVGTFVAQYFGAKEEKKIGPALWQGIYIALLGGLMIMLLAPFSKQIFAFIGHDEKVQELEAIYFSILCFGTAGPLLSSTMASFFSGMNKNWPVMWSNFLSTAVNILLDYLLIFGKFGFPRMGVTGAAIATVIAGFTPVLIYSFLAFRPKFEELYRTVSGFRPDFKLMGRILKFGFPNGLHFFLDIAGFTGFLLILGRLGETELAATNIAFNINTLAFMPMIGFGIAISMLVGQSLGDKNPELAQKSVFSGFQLTLLYMGLISLAYWFLPQLFIYPFAAKADPLEFAPVAKLAPTLLKFVALYCLFDTMNIIFASAIKGAGDTKFVMYAGIILSSCGLVVPTYLALEVFGRGLYTGWAVCTIYISILGLVYLTRFMLGKWKTMSVIEPGGHCVGANCPEVPSTESDL